MISRGTIQEYMLEALRSPESKTGIEGGMWYGMSMFILQEKPGDGIGIAEAFDELEGCVSTTNPVNGPIPSLVKCLKDELYEALCKNNSRYAVQLVQASTNIRPLITIISEYAAAQFGISSRSVAALLAVMLWVITHFGLEQFSDYYRHKTR